MDVDSAYPAFDGDGNAINRKSGDDTKMSLTIADAAATAGHQSGTYWFGLRASNAAGSSAWKAKSARPRLPSTPTPTPAPTPTPEPPSPPADPLQVSVSNPGEMGTTHWCSARADWRCTQGFTTGGAADGYTLASVTARFLAKAGSPGAVVVALYAAADTNVDDGQRPDTDNGAVLATLSGANPDTAGDHTFTCAGGGCALAANTTYFVQFAATGGGGTLEGYNWATTEADDENLNPAGNGWSLANGTDYYSEGRGWLAEYADTGLLLVSAPAN